MAKSEYAILRIGKIFKDVFVELHTDGKKPKEKIHREADKSVVASQSLNELAGEGWEVVAMVTDQYYNFIWTMRREAK